MGADLHVTSRVLDDLTSALTGFSGQLSHACECIQAGDSNLAGADPLAGRVHAFADSWQYGITQLSKHGSDCVQMLRHVGAAFDRLDQHLASELQPGKGRADGG